MIYTPTRMRNDKYSQVAFTTTRVPAHVHGEARTRGAFTVTRTSTNN